MVPRIAVTRTAVPRLVYAAHVPLGGRVAGTGVVVAAHQGEAECAMTRPPGGDSVERGGGAPAGCVQQVAQAEDVSCAAAFDGAAQAVKRAASRLLRHGHAGGAKGRGLADVQVADDQRRTRGPVDRLLRQQPQRLAPQFNPAVAYCQHDDISSMQVGTLLGMATTPNGEAVGQVARPTLQWTSLKRTVHIREVVG